MGAGGKSKTCWHGQWPWPKHANKRQNYGTGYLWPCSAAWRENVQARGGEGGPPGSPGLGSELWTHEHSHTHT